MPETAEEILTRGDADLISMARPLLADPYWVNKADQGREDEINTCIACNQACLDHAFGNKTVSCLLNPRAGHETSWPVEPDPPQQEGCRRRCWSGRACRRRQPRRARTPGRSLRGRAIGSAASSTSPARSPARRSSPRRIRYFARDDRRQRHQPQARHPGDSGRRSQGDYDEVVLATGVRPRIPNIPGVDHPMVLTYSELVRDEKPVGKKVAVIGAGGIGFDVTEFLTVEGSPSLKIDDWKEEWGVVDPEDARGALGTPKSVAGGARRGHAAAQGTSFGKGLGQDVRLGAPRGSQGQGRRAARRRRTTSGSTTRACTSAFGRGASVRASSRCDNMILCAGQESVRELFDELAAAKVNRTSSVARTSLPNSTPSARSSRAPTSPRGSSCASRQVGPCGDTVAAWLCLLPHRTQLRRRHRSVLGHRLGAGASSSPRAGIR